MSQNNSPEMLLYTVQPGDTIWSLADQYNTTAQAIMEANPGIDPNNLVAGAVIFIPDPSPMGEHDGPSYAQRPDYDRRPDRRPDYDRRPDFDRRPGYDFRPGRPPYYPYPYYPYPPYYSYPYYPYPYPFYPYYQYRPYYPYRGY